MDWHLHNFTIPGDVLSFMTSNDIVSVVYCRLDFKLINSGVSTLH